MDRYAEVQGTWVPPLRANMLSVRQAKSLGYAQVEQEEVQFE
jgi:hypothetical protein